MGVKMLDKPSLSRTESIVRNKKKPALYQASDVGQTKLVWDSVHG
jgi:hypothetical protein